MLLTIKELRNRMLNCLPTSEVSVKFLTDDNVKLTWTWWIEDIDYTSSHSLIVHIESIRANSRRFEREMHKAKRILKKG